uniref:Uncharacterized protein n=1 Tax=Sarcophilus harrisii TaxID=9305 RepID=A0A7N4NNT1_SARHA
MARPSSDRSPAPQLLGGPAGGAALHGLRSLLQGPGKTKEPPASCLLKDKERKAAAGGGGEEVGGLLGVSGRPRSGPGPGALLASLLWERPLPFGDVDDVDLDAFLLEHGLPPSPPDPGPPPPPRAAPAPSAAAPSCSSGSSSPAPSSSSSPVPTPASPRLSSGGHVLGPRAPGAGGSGSQRAGPASRDTPSPVDPESVEVLMTFDPDPADLALSSVPGQDTFDPRKHRFSEEELKPQPIMKKARKIQVPEEQKVSLPWEDQPCCTPGGRGSGGHLVSGQPFPSPSLGSLLSKMETTRAAVAEHRCPSRWPVSPSFGLLARPEGRPEPASSAPQPRLPAPPGREVLEPALQEQRGSQALAGRAAAEGEPDLGAGGLPGEGERPAQTGGGRRSPGALPLPRRAVALPGPARGPVTPPQRPQAPPRPPCFRTLPPGPDWLPAPTSTPEHSPLGRPWAPHPKFLAHWDQQALPRNTVADLGPPPGLLDTPFSLARTEGSGPGIVPRQPHYFPLNSAPFLPTSMAGDGPSGLPAGQRPRDQ